MLFCLILPVQVSFPLWLVFIEFYLWVFRNLLWIPKQKMIRLIWSLLILGLLFWEITLARSSRIGFVLSDSAWLSTSYLSVCRCNPSRRPVFTISHDQRHSRTSIASCRHPHRIAWNKLPKWPKIAYTQPYFHAQTKSKWIEWYLIMCANIQYYKVMSDMWSLPGSRRYKTSFSYRSSFEWRITSRKGWCWMNCAARHACTSAARICCWKCSRMLAGEGYIEMCYHCFELRLDLMYQLIFAILELSRLWWWVDCGRLFVLLVQLVQPSLLLLAPDSEYKSWCQNSKALIRGYDHFSASW